MEQEIILSHRDKLIESGSFWLSPIASISKYPVHSHDYFEITYFYHGQGYQIINDKREVFSAPAFFFTPPGVKHGFVSKNNEAIKQISLALYTKEYEILDSLMLVKRVIKQINENKIFTLQVRDYIPQIERTLNEFYIEFEIKNILLNELLGAFLNKIFIYINRILIKENHIFAKFGKLPPIVLKVLKNIENKYFTYNTLDDLLQGIEISPRYFNKIFKEATSFTPIQYLNRVKIENIAFQIVYKKTNISKTVIESGINDLKNFNRLFKKYIGLTPTDFIAKVELGLFDLSLIDRFGFK